MPLSNTIRGLFEIKFLGAGGGDDGGRREEDSGQRIFVRWEGGVGLRIFRGVPSSVVCRNRFVSKEINTGCPGFLVSMGLSCRED